ncbi:hypothetical protein AAC387_Pa12g0976 [Persea americana]|eukprot:TRINITY_DN2375_c0_g1_i1.p1 TRINITY_DN2375_c0_g1~~TRINITY_DN2375_c0_g1_i1.p1  ORF type:complete len:143 (+),score=31.14 TRINITY_DN2375_c0_g1_i1:227-655(+)
MSLQIQMTSTKFSYHRLKNPGDVDVREEEREERSWRGRSNRKRSWWRLRRGWIRRPRIRIPRLRRFSRRKSRKLSASWIKIWKRLKESRSYIGDLFAGNYLLMQVSPTPLGSLESSFMGHDKPGNPSSRYLPSSKGSYITSL